MDFVSRNEEKVCHQVSQIQFPSSEFADEEQTLPTWMLVAKIVDSPLPQNVGMF